MVREATPIDMRALLGIACCTLGTATVNARTGISEFRRTPVLWCPPAVPRNGVCKMPHPNTARSIAIAGRRSDDVQPTAILGTIGMIAMLMLLWIGMVL
jgi:hypothetical protein